MLQYDSDKYLHHMRSKGNIKGRAIVQVVSHRLPTAAALVWSQAMWDLWWTK
jgi:hypothetical protein